MEKITKLLLVSLLFITTIASAQYGIGTNSPSPSAQLELNSTAKGFLMPRMTQFQRDAISAPAAGLMIYNLDSNKPNFFNGISWIELAGVVVGGATVPGAPTDIVVTPGNTEASVAFTAPSNNGGAAITNYIVTANPGALTAQGTQSPITVIGLVNGTAYTFTVVAQNTVGNSASSVVSGPITPVGAPGAPTNIVAAYTAGTTQSSVSFTAPASNGGATITGYTVTSNPGGLTATGAASPLVVTGLSMNQSYTFTVVANNGSASVASVASNSITTIPVVPSAPFNLVASSSASGSASVAFDVPTSNGGAAITNYVITSIPAGGTGSGSTSPIAVSGLTNGTSYTFTLVAQNSAGNSTASNASNAVTPVGAPGAPNNAVASYIAGTTEASITFSAPASNGGATITGYTVTSNPGGLTATGTASPLVVTGLSMNQSYTFTVVANNGSASEASAASNSITTIPVVPSAPLNLVASSSASGSASVAFDVPSSNGGAAITNYVITSIPAGGTGSGSTSPIAVSGLTNGTSYTFTLVAQNSAGNSTASNASNAVTPVGAPGAPTNAVASYTAGTEASIAFNAPANNGGATTGYTVTSNPGGLTATGAASPLVVTGLSMNQSYTFTVVANNGSASVASVASNSITTIPVVPSAPFNLVASSSASGSASVAFDVPTSNGGAAITNYVITSIPAGGTGSGSTSPIAVSGLTNGTSYTFTLVAQNSAGNSTASNASNAVTPVGAPGAPNNAVASYIAGTTEASITFSAPASNGGATITGYTVTSNPGGLTATGTASPLVVTGLSMNQSYTFTVVANNGSASEASAASNSITTIPVVPSAPLNLVASSSASGSASVAFDVPTSTGGAAITNYVVTSSPAGGSGSGSSSPIAVSGLTDGTSYTFTLVAQNSAGDSPASNASNAVTPVGASQPPTNVVASYTAGTTQASIAFDAPTNNGGATITGYTVTSSPGSLTASGATSPLVVTGLTIGTSYTFTVVANNGSNSVASAASNSITASAIAPSAPLNLVASSTASGSASVAFDVPTSTGGAAITNYVVTSSPAGGSGSGSTSPIAVSGLTNGTSYTFTLIAQNSAGDSPASNASNSVTPVGAPDAPTNVIAAYVNGDTQSSVSFTAPVNNGGASITSYTITSTPGGLTATGASSPLVVAGLVVGTTYTFRVVANNSINSVPSAASNAVTVTLAPPGAPTKLAATLAGNSMTFNWTAPTTGGEVNNYIIQRRGTWNAQTWTNIGAQVSGTVTSVTIADAGNSTSTELNFRVVARNSNNANITASSSVITLKPVANSTTDFYDNFNSTPVTALWEADPTPFGWYQTASVPSFFGNATNIDKMYGQADGKWLSEKESTSMSLSAQTVYTIDRTGKTVEIQFAYTPFTNGASNAWYHSFGLKSVAGPSNGVEISHQTLNNSGVTSFTITGSQTNMSGPITAKNTSGVVPVTWSGDPTKVTVRIILLNGGGMEIWANGEKRQTWTAAELPADFNNLKFFVRAAKNHTNPQKFDDFYIFSY